MQLKLREIKYKIKELFRSPLLTIGFILILIDCFLLLYGLFWGLMTSLKSINNFAEDMFGLPRQYKWENYQTAMACFYKTIQTGAGYRRVYFFELLGNSLLMATFPVFITLFFNASVAYCCCKIKIGFNKVLHGIVMFVIVFPGVSTLGNRLEFLKTLGFYDNYLALLWGNIAFADYNFLVWYGAFQNVPNDYIEAAKMDGAGNWHVMLGIVFPLVRVQFAILYVLGFIGQWNQYITTLTTMPSMPTLALALYSFRELTTNAVSWPPIQLSACMIVAAPCIVIYCFMSPYLVGNLTVGGLKG